MYINNLTSLGPRLSVREILVFTNPAEAMDYFETKVAYIVKRWDHDGLKRSGWITGILFFRRGSNSYRLVIYLPLVH